MATFTILHAADIHLDSPLRGLERYEGEPPGRDSSTVPTELTPSPEDRESGLRR